MSSIYKLKRNGKKDKILIHSNQQYFKTIKDYEIEINQTKRKEIILKEQMKQKKIILFSVILIILFILTFILYKK